MTSVDLRLVNGDLVIDSHDSDELTTTKDLLIEDSTINMLRRSVITPPEWLGRWMIDADGPAKQDKEFGDGIYRQLSDPLNSDWVSRAYNNIKYAIELIEDPDLVVGDINVGVSSSTGEGPVDTANVLIAYEYKEVPATLKESIDIG